MYRLSMPLLWLALIWTAPAWSVFPGGQNFLSPDEAFQLQAERVDEDSVRLQWIIAEDYYLYRHALAVKAAPEGTLVPGELVVPDGIVKEDEYFGRTEVYYHELVVQLPLTGKTRREAGELQVTYQGCAEAGLCYPPQSTTVRIDGEVPSGSNGISQRNVTETLQGQVESTPANQQDQLASMLDEAALGWVLLAFFGAGLLLAFTPCVLPMLPILSSIIVGSNAGGSTRRGFILSTAYVLPMAAGYAVLGAAAGLAGANLQAFLQTPWFIVPFVAIFGLLAMAMFGFFHLQLPARMQGKLTELSNRQRGGTLIGVAAMGLLSALIVGPCMTAPLAGALLYIGQTGDVALGGLALFVLGLGMGLPLILVGTFGAKMLPRAGHWMGKVQVVFGFILLGVSIWMLGRVIPAPATVALWGVLLAAIAVGLGAFEPMKEHPGPWRHSAKAAGLVSGVWSLALLLGAAAGGENPLRPLAFMSTPTQVTSLAVASPSGADAEPTVMEGMDDLQARIDESIAAGKPVVVDFHADWCVSCKVMERRVFGNPEVRKAMADMVRIKPDVTANNPADRELMAALGVLGPPTLLFIGPDGEERRSQRIVGEVNAATFLRRIREAF